MASEPVEIELVPAGGGRLRVEWEREALEDLSGAPAGGLLADAGGSPWRLEGEVGEGALRIVSAGFEDGSVLALAAFRPSGAEGHDSELVRAVVTGADGELTTCEDALLSTEYGPKGEVRRIGLELYPDPEAVPLRGSGESIERAAGGDSDRVAMSFRMAGARGVGLYDLLRAG
jgi:hypothetical protein